MARLIATGVVFGVLVVSIPAASGIPFHPFLGLDFQNLDTFHDCIARDNPYLSSGAECGDVGARDMLYPPLLYWLFAWTRLMPFSAGALLWAAVVLGGTFIATVAWAPRARRSVPLVAFLGLLMVQFPALFAMERGNNDVLVLAFWTVAMLLYVSGHLGWSGLVAGTAVALKLYPGFAAAVVGCGLIWRGWQARAERRRLVLFAAGGLTALTIAVVVLFDQTVPYLTDELPRFAGTGIPLSAYTHALHYVAPMGMPWILSVPLLVIWVVASARRLADDSVLIFAGGLAISTYFASTSYDYNLITTYPLLTLLFVRLLGGPRNPTVFGLLILGLVGVVGHRGLFNDSQVAMQLHILLQWSWLAAVGLATAMGWLTERPDAADPRGSVLLRTDGTPRNLVDA